MGAVLAMSGVSIGLGNIWRFPYMMGLYGGSMFLFPYLAFVLFFGVPNLLAHSENAGRGRAQC
jgi:NSS family neurotransmitter:Na+ symporter